MKSKNIVTVYGCGGAGINIGSSFPELKSEGFADVKVAYVDTSRSNLIAKNIAEDSLFLFEGIDGSGKVRAQNYEDISKNTLAILQRFKPTDLNVVVHSASGGSGSVIGPSLVSELKNKGENVVVILVGSTDTRIEIENTIKTLKSYEAIAAKRGSPVVVHYLENSSTTSRQQVNRAASYAVSMLAVLYSGLNEELDSADLKNWLEYLRFTGGQPQLSSLNFSIGDVRLAEVGTIASVATLATPEMNTRLSETPAYQTVGYVPESYRVGAKDSLQVIKDSPIHFLISADFITGAVQALTSSLKQVDERYASQVARSSILGKGDDQTDTGLVL